MTISEIVETKDNRYIDGVVSEEIAFCIGGGEVLGEPILDRRDVAVGTQVKKFYPSVHRDSVENNPEGVTLYEKLIKTTHSYETSGAMKRWAIMAFRYWYWYDKTGKALEQMVDMFFSSATLQLSGPSEIGTITVMDTDYAVALEIQSKGPIKESISVGGGTALQGYYPLGKGCGGESESNNPVEVYSMVIGTEHKFKLKFERQKRSFCSK